MAVNTSKFTLQHIYSLVAFHFGKVIADGVEFPMIDELTFVRLVNECLDDITIAADTTERLVILTPDRRWLRYIKATPEEENSGIIRIDLEGQTPTLLSANDPDNLDWQYEDPCDGTGCDPDYDGESTGPPVRSPDSFPKFYLPAESDIPLLSYYRTNAAGAVVFPAGNQWRIGGDNEPLTPFIVDMRKVGYGSGTPTDDTYPTTSQTDLFFVDPFLMGALLCIDWTQGGTTYTSVIPHSNDEYLNSNWEVILGMGDNTGAWTIGVVGVGTFIIDGVTWTTSIVNNTFNSTTNVAGTIRITSAAGEAFDYDITPNRTPWTDVVIGPAANVHIWDGLFGQQALYSNRAWYIKVSDFVLRLPDDLSKIKWVWKIPTNSMYINIPEDADDDEIVTALSDAESYMYSRYDEAYHYFPITETRFTQLKYLETQGYDFNGAGFYTQFGQQLRLVPRPTDLKSAVIAVYYEAKADNIAETTTVSDFATTYVELPSPAVKAIQYRIQASIYASSRGGGNMEQAAFFYGLYEKELRKLEKLYSGRMRQSHDAPNLKQIFDPQRDVRHFGLKYIGR